MKASFTTKNTKTTKVIHDMARGRVRSRDAAAIRGQSGIFFVSFVNFVVR